METLYVEEEGGFNQGKTEEMQFQERKTQMKNTRKE